MAQWKKKCITFSWCAVRTLLGEVKCGLSTAIIKTDSKQSMNMDICRFRFELDLDFVLFTCFRSFVPKDFNKSSLRNSNVFHALFYLHFSVITESQYEQPTNWLTNTSSFETRFCIYEIYRFYQLVFLLFFLFDLCFISSMISTAPQKALQTLYYYIFIWCWLNSIQIFPFCPIFPHC